MSRQRRWCLGIVGGLLAALLLLFYTPPGLAIVGRLASPLTGGQVRVEGLSGVFPDRLHIALLEVSDKKGVWLRIDQAALEWSALALIRNHVDIEKVSASHIAVLRRPFPSEIKSSGKIPRIDIAQLSATNITLSAPVIGHAVILAASGKLHYTSMQNLAANLLVTRLGSRDRYRINGGIREGVARGSASIQEGVEGILGKLANLPGLGAVNLSAQAAGDASANTISFNLSAGQLTVQGQGTIALATSRADIDMTLAAPAMAPRPDTSWSTLSGDMHVHGGFTTPQVSGHFALSDGRVAGASVAILTLDANGHAGRVNVTGTAEKLIVPGDAGLLARAPLQFTALADLRDPLRPVRLSLNHPLVRLEAMVQTAKLLHVSGDLTVPSLAPVGALTKTPLAGHAALHATVDMQGKQTRLALDGTLHMMGAALPAKLLGDTQLAMTAVLEGEDITASQLAINGAAMKIRADGSLRGKRLNYALSLDLTDLSKLANTLQGTVTFKANAAGPLDGAELIGSGNALMATNGFARQRIAIELKAQGLGAMSNATLALVGRLDGAPLTLRAAITGEKARHVMLTSRWRSLDVDADLSLAENGALGGKARVALKQLPDVAALTGAKLSGSANAALTFYDERGKTGANIDARLSGFSMAPIAAQSVSLRGTASDITGRPRLDVTMNAGRITAQGWTSDAQGKIQGSLDRLDVAVNATFTDAGGNMGNMRGAGMLDLLQRRLALAALTGDWRTLKLVLDAPATLHFGKGLVIDRLAAHLGKGRLVVTGTLSPVLTLTASADDINLADYAAFMPSLGPQGTFSGTAEVHGTLAAPFGRISLRGQNMRAAFWPSGIPPARVTLVTKLQGEHATVDTTLDAGADVHLTLKGGVPLLASVPMALHGDGKVDLALLDAVTAISGRRVRGTITLVGDAVGPLSALRISGRGSLANGEFQDYAQGVRVQDIVANFNSDGNRLTVSGLSGRAGPGILSGSGTIDLTAQGMPITMKLDMQNARPITSDLMTADLSGSLTLSGHVKTAMTLGGDIQVTRANINVPQSFPPAVAVLNVRRRGQPPPTSPPQPSRIDLGLRVRTTGPVFVRGHGMDADMGGAFRVGGTIGAPAVLGDFRMNRGTYSLAGQTLNFSSGQVRFDGSGLRGRLDPSLNFIAQTMSGGVTATLTINGYASQPKIALTSTPSLPQDEVVAHLLFQQSVKQLSPLQLASIAQAAAEMGGIGGGFNPLGSVRRTLGLDRLAVGSAQGGASGTESQTTVEAGRYVARNVYVGVKQNLSGGTQTEVQVDITRRLKAQATVNTGATTSTVQGNALQDNGSSIGLSYQFQY